MNRIIGFGALPFFITSRIVGFAGVVGTSAIASATGIIGGATGLATGLLLDVISPGRYYPENGLIIGSGLTGGTVLVVGLTLTALAEEVITFPGNILIETGNVIKGHPITYHSSAFETMKTGYGILKAIRSQIVTSQIIHEIEYPESEKAKIMEITDIESVN